MTPEQMLTRARATVQPFEVKRKYAQRTAADVVALKAENASLRVALADVLDLLRRHFVGSESADSHNSEQKVNLSEKAPERDEAPKSSDTAQPRDKPRRPIDDEPRLGC